MEKAPTLTGLIDERTSFLACLLKRPECKDALRTFLTHIDPESGARLVRTVLETDPEVPFALVSTAPALVNLVVRALLELVEAIRRSFPAPLMAGFVEALLRDVNRKDLARLQEGLRALADELGPAFASFTGEAPSPLSTKEETR